MADNQDHFRSSDIYKKWRKIVLKRDGYRCQMPGCSVSKALQVHHIQRWSDAPTLRYTPDNGITLCKPCHKSVNKKEAFFAVLFLSIIRKNNKR